MSDPICDVSRPYDDPSLAILTLYCATFVLTVRYSHFSSGWNVSTTGCHETGEVTCSNPSCIPGTLWTFDMFEHCVFSDWNCMTVSPSQLLLTKASHLSVRPFWRQFSWRPRGLCSCGCQLPRVLSHLSSDEEFLMAFTQSGTEPHLLHSSSGAVSTGFTIQNIPQFNNLKTVSVGKNHK